jgi:Glycosyltransferase family 87
MFFIRLRERVERGYPDFTVFYTAARILRLGLGQQLYVGCVQNQVQKAFTGELPSRSAALRYIHPPFEALIFLPLSWLPYRLAYVVWDLINVSVLFTLLLLLRPGVGILRLLPLWESVLWTVAFFPVFECLLQGQDSILQLLFCVLAWNALEKEEDILAGCWFAFGAFKFQLMIPIVLLIAIWRRRRVLIGFAAVSLVLSAISFALVGWQGLLRYPAFAVQVADTPRLGGVPVDFLPNLHGLFMGGPLRFGGRAGAAIVIVSSLVLFLFAAARGRRIIELDKIDLRFSMAVAVSDLIAWQTNIHDFTLLVLPLILIADRCLNVPEWRSGTRWSLLYPVSPILISPVWLILWLAIGNINLLAIALLWWVWELGQLRRAAATPEPASNHSR